MAETFFYFNNDKIKETVAFLSSVLGTSLSSLSWSRSSLTDASALQTSSFPNSTSSSTASSSSSTSPSSNTTSLTTSVPSVEDPFSFHSWDLLLKFSTPHTLTQKDVVSEGDSTLYRIRSGSALLLTLENKICTKISDNDLFGEVSFLKTEPHYKLQVESEKLELDAFPFAGVIRLLSDEPGLSLRFYKSLAVRLAKRLSSLTKFTTTSEELSTQTRFRRDFPQTKDEEAFGEYECILKSNDLKRYGTLYTARFRFYFFSKIFGSEAREIVHSSQILAPKKSIRDGEFQIRFMTVDKAKVFRVFLKTSAEAEIVMNQLVTARNYAIAAAVAQQVGSPPTKDIGKSPTSRDTIHRRIGRLLKQTTDSSGSLAQSQMTVSMSNSEWDSVLQQSKLWTFHKDQVIVQQNAKLNCIYHLAKGSCRIEKHVEGGPEGLLRKKGGSKKGGITSRTVRFGTLGPGEIFGDLSFLLEGLATANVIANEETRVYSISSPDLLLLFVRRPAFGGKFYRYLATLLAERLLKKDL